MPVVSAFGVTNGMASITVANALKELYYRPFSSATPRDFTSELGGKKTKVVTDGPLIVTAGATESNRFYRVGVTDDPRE